MGFLYTIKFYRLYGLYTMEVILATGFGHYVNVINSEADELTEASAAIFNYARGSGNRTNSTIIYCKLICHQN